MTVATVEVESSELGATSVRLDDVELLAEHTGLSVEACLERLRTYRVRELADEWRRRAPRSPAEIDAFYGGTDLYAFELLVWNGSGLYAEYLERLDLLAARFPPAEHPRALDFGCGIGTAACRLAELGYEVTAVDLPGRTLDFARARFLRRGHDIRVLAAGSESPPAHGAYDVVVCFDVLEHLPDPRGTARDLVRALKPGGGAALVTSFDVAGADWPHHLEHGRRALGGHRWRLYADGLGLKWLGNDVYCKTGRAGRALRRARFWLWRATSVHVSRLPR